MRVDPLPPHVAAKLDDTKLYRIASLPAEERIAEEMGIAGQTVSNIWNSLAGSIGNVTRVTFPT